MTDEKMNFKKLLLALRKKGQRNFEIAKATEIQAQIILQIASGITKKVEYNNGKALLNYAGNYLVPDEIEECREPVQ